METTTEKKDWKTLVCLIAFGVLLLTGIFYGGYVSECERAEYERHRAEIMGEDEYRYTRNMTREERRLYDIEKELREINRKL